MGQQIVNKVMSVKGSESSAKPTLIVKQIVSFGAVIDGYQQAAADNFCHPRNKFFNAEVHLVNLTFSELELDTRAILRNRRGQVTLNPDKIAVTQPNVELSQLSIMANNAIYRERIY